MWQRFYAVACNTFVETIRQPIFGVILLVTAAALILNVSLASFTLATGTEDDRKLGLETLEGIRLIHERFPECGILLGLSNISFGLRPPTRAVINSVFLHEAIKRGLTVAIVHASKILPRNKAARTKARVSARIKQLQQG